MQHLNVKVDKHENSYKHIHNATNFNLFGKIDIRRQIDSGYKIIIQRHNELIDKNRYVLDKILKCIICCGKLDLCTELDSNLRDHFENPTVFKETLKTIQNDLLDPVLSESNMQR